MSKIPRLHFQMESGAIVFSISSLINFGIVYIWSIYRSLYKRIWFTILSFFFHLKENWTLFEILIFFRWVTFSVRLSIVGIVVSIPLQKYQPALPCKAPLNWQTVQAPVFRQFLPLYWFFMTPLSLKVRFFSELQKY